MIKPKKVMFNNFKKFAQLNGCYNNQSIEAAPTYFLALSHFIRSSSAFGSH